MSDGHTYQVRQRCTVIEETEWRVTLPHPIEHYTGPGGDFEGEDAAYVLRSAVDDEIEGATHEAISTEHEDDPITDYNEWDNVSPVEEASTT